MLTLSFTTSNITNLDVSAKTMDTKNKHGRMYNPGRPLAMADRQRILQLYEKGHKISHIARIIGVTHSCVSKIMTRYRRTGSMHPRSTTNGKQRNLSFGAIQINSDVKHTVSANTTNDNMPSKDDKVPLSETVLISRPYSYKPYSINSILYEI
uniref:Paired domain-containing protein n=1 Tax=Syphacia muris TaxID=451379 RepID=A0A0N5AJE7_9BILA